jgi:hypothetical protein
MDNRLWGGVEQAHGRAVCVRDAIGWCIQVNGGGGRWGGVRVCSDDPLD